MWGIATTSQRRVARAMLLRLGGLDAKDVPGDFINVLDGILLGISFL